MLVGCYGFWMAAGLWLFSVSPWLALPVMAIAAALHASLQHEAVHGHPTRNAHINELLVALPLSVFFPYRRFKQMHLRHHNDERLTDPYDDPESWYRAGRDWNHLPVMLRWLLTINNTLLGRVLIGPTLMVAGFVINDVKKLVANERGIRRAWLNHAAGLTVLAVIVSVVFAVPLWLYVVAVAYPAMSLIAIRTYCEHQWAETPDGRTIIVENSRILSWLFLNNSFHLVHHAEPNLPWYALPARFRAEREHWLARNNGYAFSTYWDIARHYLLRRKEPVVHPALHKGVVDPVQGATIPTFPVNGPRDIVVPSKPQIR